MSDTLKSLCKALYKDDEEKVKKCEEEYRIIESVLGPGYFKTQGQQLVKAISKLLDKEGR